MLTKSAKPGKVQLTFVHVNVVNKTLGESVVDFSLAEDLSSPSIASISMIITFVVDGKKPTNL